MFWMMISEFHKKLVINENDDYTGNDAEKKNVKILKKKNLLKI